MKLQSEHAVALEKLVVIDITRSKKLRTFTHMPITRKAALKSLCVTADNIYYYRQT
jgi:hypothetical protein